MLENQEQRIISNLHSHEQSVLIEGDGDGEDSVRQEEQAEAFEKIISVENQLLVQETGTAVNNSGEFKDFSMVGSD